MLSINHTAHKNARASTATKGSRANAHVAPQRDTAIRCDICEKRYPVSAGQEAPATRVPVATTNQVWSLWDSPRACPTCGNLLGWVCLWD